MIRLSTPSLHISNEGILISPKLFRTLMQIKNTFGFPPTTHNRDITIAQAIIAQIMIFYKPSKEGELILNRVGLYLSKRLSHISNN